MALVSPSKASPSQPMLSHPISTQTLARLLLVVAASTVLFNIICLLPHIPGDSLQANPYFFSENGFMHTTSKSSGKTNTTVANHHSSRTGSDDRSGKSISDWFRDEAGVVLTPEMKEKLPTWSQVREVVGEGPVILGLESCPAYREKVPALERMLGSSGMFNTGTNLVTHLLKRNCEIPERREKMGPNESKESYGMRWQVPWGKHTPVKFRNKHSTQKAKEIKKEFILPVVTTRHPYSWFGSMCKNGYTARWDHQITRKKGDGKNERCPRLRQGSRPAAPWNPVKVTYAEKREDNHLSLAHLWNDWYSYYTSVEGNFPFLIIRMEDMVFYPEELITQVCECAGGKIRTDQKFQLITDSAKGDSRGHDTSTGIYEAWIKYSKPNTKERYGFSEADYNDARTALNETFMKALGYQHPS